LFGLAKKLVDQELKRGFSCLKLKAFSLKLFNLFYYLGKKWIVRFKLYPKLLCLVDDVTFT